MNLIEVNEYFNSFLKDESYNNDISLNGIQIENSDSRNKKIKRIAFAVDACEETAEKAALLKADILFVHHGLFWGQCERITNSHYRRIRSFIKNDLALVAYHIPLDANNPYGNNYGIASKLDLVNLQPFASWRNMLIGVKGELKRELSIEEICELVLGADKQPSCMLKFGKDKIKSIGISSGGSGEDVNQAAEQGLDLFLTGTFEHEQYHYAKEMKMNVLAGGHYQTETFGVSAIKEKVEKETDIECFFIDVPTGL